MIKAIAHGSLFSGIGGWDIAAEYCQWTNVFQVEIDKFCQKVLKKNFPNTRKYEDIKDFDATEYAGTIDVLSGSPPCQPFSVAGRRRGSGDNRHLWSEMLRIIQQIKPPFVVAENVPGLLTIENGLVFEQMCIDLENEGYEVQPFIIPACAVNAWHRRNRVWIIANSNRKRCKDEQKENREIICDKKRNNTIKKQIREKQQCRINESNSNAANAQSAKQKQSCNTRERRVRLTDSIETWNKNWIEVATELCRVDDGIPAKLDRSKRIAALGNAIMPQIAVRLFEMINRILSSEQFEEQKNL